MKELTRRRIQRAVLLIGSGLLIGFAVQFKAVATRASSDGTWTMPRTPDGHPDLQGVWNNSTQTPLERPTTLGTKQFYTDDELARMRLRDHDAHAAAGDPGTYNQFWWEEGALLKQTSLIVDPPDGRIPPLTPEGARRRAARDARGRDRADSPEDRNLAERCITRSVPKLPGGYNNNFQILQASQYVAILQEMIHEVRIIPLDGRPHAPSAIRSYLGDSRARWEGDTLVVETTNFNSKIDETSYNCCGGAAENLAIVEHLTLIDSDTIDYQYTVRDPTIFTRPWTVKVPMRRAPGPIFEYACHEGNYSMAGILRGARAEEKSGQHTVR
jgi:hypothetical protein